MCLRAQSEPTENEKKKTHFKMGTPCLKGTIIFSRVIHIKKQKTKTFFGAKIDNDAEK